MEIKLKSRGVVGLCQMDFLRKANDLLRALGVITVVIITIIISFSKRWFPVCRNAVSDDSCTSGICFINYMQFCLFRDILC